MNTAKYKALDIANWLIANTIEHGDQITNLKLQKLIYYAEVWHLLKNQSSLFEERIEAWTHGPVIPAVYHEFKQHQWNNIPFPKNNIKLDNLTTELLNNILEVYGECSARHLEKLTHQEAPWINARKGLPIEDRCSEEITRLELITFYKEHYKDYLDEEEKS